MSKSELKAMIPALVLYNAINLWLIFKLGTLGSYLSLLFVVPIGIAFGLVARDIRKKEKIKLWRETHPNAAKDFIPEDLK